MADNETLESMRASAWDEAFHCYGAAFILEQRSSWFEKAFFFHDLLSFGFPVLVGLIALSFQINEKAFGILTAVGFGVGIATMLFSITSLVGRWHDKHQQYQRQIVTNQLLFDDFRRFGRNPPKNEYRKQFEIIDIRRQESEKGAVAFTEEEKRFGYRFAARQMERECKGCNIKPMDMKSTACSVCGNFKKKFK